MELIWLELLLNDDANSLGQHRLVFESLTVTLTSKYIVLLNHNYIFRENVTMHEMIGACPEVIDMYFESGEFFLITFPIFGLSFDYLI